jgi:hypothetical protein
VTFHDAVNEFFAHCRIKGLSSETVKFYQKELKQAVRAYVDIDIPVTDIRKSIQIISRIFYVMKAQRAATAECYAARANFDCLRENIFEYMLMNIND